MSFEKIKRNLYCVGGRHCSATTNIYGDTTFKGIKVLIGYCLSFNRKESMVFSENTVLVDNLGDFVKSLGEKGLKVSKRMAKTVLKTQDEPWILQQTLLAQLLLDTLKRLYYRYQSLIILIIPEKAVNIRKFV